MAIRPLTAAMDNVLAWRMGEALSHAFLAPKGDYIDGGLALLRELNDRGFDVVIAEKTDCSAESPSL